MHIVAAMDEAIDVKALRERLGWDQAAMADYLGLDRSSVSRMENGQEPKGPVRKLLEQLSERGPDVRPSEETGAAA